MATPSWRGLGRRYSLSSSLSSLETLMADGMQIALSYIALTTVLFLFPPDHLVTGSSMSALAPMSTAMHS